MPLSQMFDKVFGMIKSDMYAIKLQASIGVRPHKEMAGLMGKDNGKDGLMI